MAAKVNYPGPNQLQSRAHIHSGLPNNNSKSQDLFSTINPQSYNTTISIPVGLLDRAVTSVFVPIDVLPLESEAPHKIGSYNSAKSYRLEKFYSAFLLSKVW